jgi:hypothetical protein
MGWPAQALSGPVRAHLRPCSSSWHFGLFRLDLCHFEVVIPAIKIGGLLVWSPNLTSYSSGMIRRTTFVLATFGSDFSLHSNTNETPHFAPLNLLWIRPFCPCFSAKTQYFQMHIRSWTCYIISVPSGWLVANHNRNQCITSTLGWWKFTVNTRPRASTRKRTLSKVLKSCFANSFFTS